jgi:hypothetical protein
MKQVKTLNKPRGFKVTEKTVMPKLYIIGNSVGFVIGKALLKSIDWRKQDRISYRYEEGELRVVNYTAKMRKEKRREKQKHAIHKKY